MTLSPGGRAYTYRISVVAAIGGLLFGFDTAIINGAIVFLRRQFAWSELQTEIAASSLLVGCIIGASAAGALSDWLGRRRILLLSAAIFALSSVATSLPNGLGLFCAARLVAGIAIGIASLLCPGIHRRSVTRRHPRDARQLNQLAIVTGILISYLVGWSLSSLGPESWRWMFASAAFPSILFYWALFTVPESPRWLAKERRYDDALAILTRLGEPDAALRLKEIQAAVEEETGSLAQLFQPGFRLPLVIGVTLAVFQQITGINTVLYYGSIIFTEHAGSQSASAALWANVIIGAMNLVCTVLALFVIDRLGRKALLMIASGGMGISLGILGMIFLSHPSSGSPVLALILCYVAFFSVGMGPTVWVVISELFPTRIRGRAMSIATISLWAACTLITLSFLSLVKAISVSGAFWCYAAMCIFTFLFVWRVTPETKGKTLEEIEAEFR